MSHLAHGPRFGMDPHPMGPHPMGPYPMGPYPMGSYPMGSYPMGIASYTSMLPPLESTGHPLALVEASPRLSALMTE